MAELIVTFIYNAPVAGDALRGRGLSLSALPANDFRWLSSGPEETEDLVNNMVVVCLCFKASQ